MFTSRGLVKLIMVYLCLGIICNEVGSESAVIQETWVQTLGWEDPLERGMATHSNILAWRISWTEEPDGLPFMGHNPWGHKESDMTKQLTLSLKKNNNNWATFLCIGMDRVLKYMK